MRKVYQNILFIDKNLKLKLYQLESFALKSYQKDELSQLLYFMKSEDAQAFYSKLQSNRDPDYLAKLMKEMSSSIGLIREQRINLTQKHVAPNLDEDDHKDVLKDIADKMKKPQLNSKRISKLKEYDELYCKALENYPFNTPSVEILPEQCYTLYFDGASRNNPGKAGVGIALFQNMRLIKEISQPIGIQTNNVSEFTALLFGIRYCVGVGIEYLNCFGDSKLAIDGMNYKQDIKKSELLFLKRAIKAYAGLMKDVRYSFIFREQNSIADSLSKKATNI